MSQSQELQTRIFEIIYSHLDEIKDDVLMIEFLRTLGTGLGLVTNHRHRPFRDEDRNRRHLPECNRCGRSFEVHKFIPPMLIRRVPDDH